MWFSEHCSFCNHNVDIAPFLSYVILIFALLAQETRHLHLFNIDFIVGNVENKTIVAAW